MRGEKGTGKSRGAEYFGGIFGQHFLQITNPHHLTGHFNGHLRDVLFLFVDEGFWGGDKAGESVLKGHITEPYIVIEEKGKNAERYPNRLHIWMATNSD